MEDTQSGAWVQEAAMMLRRRRRDLVMWSQSARSVGRYGAPPRTRARRIRRWLRTGLLLTFVGLMALARAVWSRWRPLLAGAVLTAAGVMLRSGPGGMVLLPGLICLMSAPLMPGGARADRRRRAELERELAAYSTPAQRRDLEATLDQYPDDVTRELRDILARQATAARGSRFPAVGRY
jgi:hypothetical protein